MARLHGRKGRLYAAVASGASASPIPFISQFQENYNADQADVTAFGDSNHSYVLGLPDAKGTFSGFYDDSTAQFFTAALDGISRKFYWYHDTGDLTKYVYGLAFFDQSYDTAVTDGQKISGNWVADGTITKV